MEKKQFKNFNPLKGIKVVEEEKRFESYIGWSFSNAKNIIKVLDIP